MKLTMKTKKEKCLLFLIFIIIISISIFLFSYGNDFYWHLKSGEYITKNHKIPFTDIFSWYASKNQLTWISHEWLFEIIIYLLFEALSKLGIFLYTLLTILFTAIIVWKQNKKIFLKSPFYTIIWAILGLLMFAGKVFPRPHLLSYLFLSLTVYFIYDTLKYKKSKQIYFAPLIGLLWANTHGGSSNLSYLIYGLVLIISPFPFKTKYLTNIKLDKLQKRKFLYAFISSIIVIFLNPQGGRLFLYPYLNMTYTKMLNCIEEWQSLSFSSIDGFFYFSIIISITILIIYSKKVHHLIDILLLIIFTILGIKSTRFIPYLFIIYSAIIPTYWGTTKIKIQLTPIFIFLISTIFYFYLFSNQKEKFNLISEDMIHYLKQDNITLYNSYDLGGYLIYKGIPVFIDGRADLYVETILCDVCEIEQGKNTKLLDKYPFNTFLVQNHSKIEFYLRNNPKYQLKLKDKENSLYILK